MNPKFVSCAVVRGWLGAVALWLAVAPLVSAAENKALRPNVVFILADDLGWGDVGFHGSEIKTPNIDRLAETGTRLEQFYVQPVCSPTRAAFMTGRYPIRYGLHIGVVRPWAQYGLPLDERTLAQGLKEAGYTTAITGKWHLGHFEPAYLPTRRGFDHQYGHYNGALDYFKHERDGGFDWHRDDKVAREEGYATHLIAREATRLIGAHDTKKPLFLYVPFNAVHSPHQVPESYLAPFAHLKGNRRLYAGMLAAMDEAIGQIIDAVEKKGMRQNTLIFFCSDNGGPAPGVVTSNGPLRASKGTLYEGGVRVPAVASWPGTLKAGAIVNAPMHMVDWYPTLITLAGGSLQQKHPLDGKDAWRAIMGGAATRDEMLHNVTATGGAVRVGDWKLVMNGQNRDAEDGPPEVAAAAAEAKETKVAAKKKKGAKKAEKTENAATAATAGRVELFNIKDDPYEKTNLAEKEPAKTRELQAKLEAYIKAAAPAKGGAIPAGFKTPKVWGERD
ncbi:MAG: arylsulfatase [Verrucomicrobiota bacterium]